MSEWLEKAGSAPEMVSALVLLRRLHVAFGFGCTVALVHYLTTGRRTRRLDHSFLVTLVLLSVLIALVTLVIGDSLSRAFSLAGALAIIRFRTVVEDTRDTAFVIYAVVAGMAAARDYYLGPLACLPAVFLTAWVLRPRRDGSTAKEGILILRLGAGRPPDDRVQAVLSKHLIGHRLTGLSTARGGSALDATFSVRLPTADKIFALVTELTGLDGVQGVELKEG